MKYFNYIYAMEKITYTYVYGKQSVPMSDNFL
jgi:hypothetical protein